MAKTTSQIIAENKIKRAEAAAIAASRDKIHQQQMAGVADQSAAKTLAVLNKAISGTSDSTKKSELSRAAQMATKAGPKTATDMQKKKEDRIEEKSQVDSFQIKKDRAKKTLEDYQKSDAYNQKKAERVKKYQDDQLAAALIGNGYTPKMDDDPEELRLMAALEQAEKEYNDAEDEAVIASDLEAINSLSDEERRMLEQYAVGRDVDYYDSMNMAHNGLQIGRAEDAAMGLIQKYGEKRVNEMANTLSRVKNAETASEVTGKGQEQVNSGLGRAVAANAASVPAGVLSGIGGTMDYIKELGRKDTRFKTLDPNAMGNLGNIYSGAVRGQSAQNISDWLGGGIAGEIGSSVYQGAMSAADSIARAFLGGGAFGGAALAATNSFSQTMADASKQGATPAQAALLATATAGIEALSEKLPLDNLIKTAKGGNGAAVVKNIFRQMGIEIMEEEASLLGTLLAEAAIMLEKSDYNQTVTAQILLGKSPEEARQAAALDVFWEVVNTALVSGVSGFGSGATASYADAANLFKEKAAEKAAQNPQLTKSDKKSAAQARAELIAKHAAQQGKTEAQQAQEAMDMAMEEAAQKVPQTAPAPLAEEQQNMENAAAVVNGVEPKEISPQERGLRYKTSQVNAAILDMVDRVKRGLTKGSEKVALGKVSDSNAAQIQRETGIDTRGYDVAIEARQIEHILKDHGENGAANHSMANPEDIARIEYALNNPDRITKSEPTKAYVTNKNGKMKPADTVLYETRLEDGSYYVVQAVPETKKKTLYVLTAFIGKSDYNSEAPQITNVNSPSATPKAESTVTSREATQSTNAVDPSVTPNGESTGASTDIVPETNAEVNGNSAGDGNPAQSTPVADTMEQSADDGQQGENYEFEHPDPIRAAIVRAAIAEFRKSDEYKAMSRDQRLQDIKEITDYLTKVADENEPGIAVVSDGGQRELAEQNPGIKGTGAAEANFTGTAAYDNLLSDDNVQRDRKGDVRYIEVPKTDADGRNVSEFVGNSMNSALTPESFTDNIKKLVQEGKVSHDVQTNEESLRKAAESIVEDCKGATDGSVRRSVEKIKDFANEGSTSPEAIAKAVLLYQHLTDQLDQQTKNGNVNTDIQDQAEDVYLSLSKMATNSGRAMQLFSLFRKMTPEGQVNILRKEIQQEIAKYQKRGTVKKDYQPQMDEQLLDIYRDAAEEFQKASTPKAKQAAEQKMQEAQNTIYAWEAAKMPTTFKAKWDAWRYMAMLGNAKTQIRNVAGNALMMPYTAVKRKVSALLEKGISKDQRTKAVVQDRQLLDWAKSDRADDLIKTALERSAKLGDDLSSSAFSDNIKTFGDGKIGEMLNTLEKAIGDVTSAGDIIFKNREYAQSLAGFLKARGYTAADVQTEGGVPAEVLNEARNYAITEALKVTFNDANMLSDALSGLRYNGENKALRAISTFFEGLMPFRKTPANVVMRFKDYSPIGLAQGLGNMAFNVRRGKVSAATAIDQISSGLTGTGAMMLGYALAGGLFGFKLTGSGTDEDEKRQGHQDYALEFSWNGEDYSYKIDWASPANLPLFMGANLRQMWEAEDTASFYTAAAGTLSGMWEPLLELSCLSSLNDLAEGLRYAEEGEAVFTALSKAATSYFTQGVPALARQATQAATQSKQTTFVTSDDPMIQKGQKALAGVGVGNVYKTDKVNAWGEKETEDNWMIRAVNAFANPGTLKKIDNSALEQEIARLNSVQETNVTPDTASKTVSYTDKNGDYHDNVRLTEEQYQTLATTQGQTAKTILESMISSKDYAAMSDEEKAKAISEVYSYAKAKAEIAAIGESHTGYSESWMMELEEGKEAAQIINRVANSELNRTMSALSTAWEKGYDTTSRSNDLKWAYDTFAAMSSKAKAEVRDAATASVRSYIEAREGGVSHDRYLSVLKQLNSIQPEADNKNPRDIQKAETVVKASGLTNKQKELLVKQQVSDTQDENIDQLKALGYGVDIYPKLYRDYLDYTKGTGKKNRTIAKWQQDYGIDYSTAKKLYEVFQ